ncbi:MAG: hypothetical protein RQ723_04895 [Desulfuromonadales bacterium]|nr:hypothetical protein [Desulfuromonadales bacterium]
MPRDRFDQILLAALAVTLTGLGLLLLVPGASTGQVASPALSRQVEKEMLSQARLSLLERRYAPVHRLLDQGELSAAMLKLEELSRDLPGEVHSNLLRGDVLWRMGQLDKALTQFALAVRGNPDYVDAASPLNQRDLIEAALTQGLPQVRDRLRSQPGSRVLEQVLRDGYYLQSRLAGGCE